MNTLFSLSFQFSFVLFSVQLVLNPFKLGTLLPKEEASFDEYKDG